MSDIAWTVLKMVCMGFTVRLQRHTKVFWYVTVYGGKMLHILEYLYSTKYNKINIYHSDIPKHVSYNKCYKKSKYFIYRLTQKFSYILCPSGERDF